MTINKFFTYILIFGIGLIIFYFGGNINIYILGILSMILAHLIIEDKNNGNNN